MPATGTASRTSSSIWSGEAVMHERRLGRLYCVLWRLIAWCRACPASCIRANSLWRRVSWLGPSGVGLWGTLQVRPCKLSRRLLVRAVLRARQDRGWAPAQPVGRMRPTHAAHAPSNPPPPTPRQVVGGHGKSRHGRRRPPSAFPMATTHGKKVGPGGYSISRRLFAKMHEAGQSPASGDRMRSEEQPGRARLYGDYCASLAFSSPSSLVGAGPVAGRPRGSTAEM